ARVRMRSSRRRRSWAVTGVDPIPVQNERRQGADEAPVSLARAVGPGRLDGRGTVAAGGRVMAKGARAEVIEVPVEQISYVPGAPVGHFRATRRWWAAHHGAVAAVARRAALAAGAGSTAGAGTGLS